MSKPLTEEQLRKKVSQQILDGDLDMDFDDSGEVIFYCGFWDDGNNHFTENEPDPDESDDDLEDSDDEDDDTTDD